MLVYLSGPHGAGKSTLAKTVVERFPNPVILYPEDTFTFPKVEENYYERLKAKLLRYYFEYIDQKKKDTINSLLLCNRCVYDSVAYSRAYHALGWINSAQLRTLQEITDRLFDQLPKKVIILNPSFETLQHHLETRWATGTKKWSEDNFMYLSAVQQEFSVLYQDRNESEADHSLLYLSEESLEEKVNVVNQWLHLDY